MKNRFCQLLCVCFSFSFFASCSRTTIQQEREVDRFTGIRSCYGVDVHINSGTSSTLTVESVEGKIDDIITEVKDGVLNISLKSNNSGLNWWLYSPKKVYVTVDDLNLIEATSGSDIEGTESLKANSINISATSGSDISLILEADSITCSITSGADLILTGSAHFVDAQAASGSDINMKEMVVEKANVNASSGADIGIQVTKELKATASSGSDINYYGNPSVTDVSASSGADIIHR